MLLLFSHSLLGIELLGDVPYRVIVSSLLLIRRCYYAQHQETFLFVIFDVIIQLKCISFSIHGYCGVLELVFNTPQQTSKVCVVQITFGPYSSHAWAPNGGNVPAILSCSFNSPHSTRNIQDTQSRDSSTFLISNLLSERQDIIIRVIPQLRVSQVRLVNFV